MVKYKDLIKHKFECIGYYTVIILLQLAVLGLSVFTLVLTIRNYKPDLRWNKYMDRLRRSNQIDAFLNQALFYIGIDYKDYKKKKSEYVAAHSDRVLEGYIKTLLPIEIEYVQDMSVLMPFGSCQKLKGELILRRMDIMKMEYKDTNLQLISIVLLSTVIFVTFVHLILAITLYKKKPVLCDAVNIVFHVMMIGTLSACLILYIQSSNSIKNQYKKIAKVVAELAIEMYQKHGFTSPYVNPPPNVKYNPNHIVPFCGLRSFKWRRTNYVGGQERAPRYSCHRERQKFTVMLLMGANILIYLTLALANLLLGDILKKKDTTVVILTVENKPPGYKPKKRRVKNQLVFSVSGVRENVHHARRSSMEVPMFFAPLYINDEPHSETQSQDALSNDRDRNSNY